MKQFLWLLGCVCCVTLVGASAHADAPSDARHQRLEGLDDEERALLMPLMERGPVALVEFAQEEELPQVLVADLVEAPAAVVAKVISQPRDYPKFMRTLDHVEILSQSETQISYKWAWQTGMLFLEGENRMTALPPPADHPEQGFRITVNSERGALGEGRLLWRVLPLSPTRSLIMLAMRVDMRDANFVMRQLDAAARSINRSVNLALTYVMLLGAKRESERKVGFKRVLPKVVFGPPELDPRKYRKLLSRADLLLMEFSPTGLGKLAIVGRTGVTPDKLWPVMTEPDTFGKTLVPGSYARVSKREGNTKTFDWGINLPLVGTSGTMQMAERDGTLWIDATEGSLKGGKWRFATPTLQNGEALLVGYSIFDVSRTTWLIEKIAAMDPVMGHGIAAASQLMMLRALRKRAHQVVKEQAAAAKLSGTPLPAASANAAAAPKAAPGKAAPAPAASSVAPSAPASADSASSPPGVGPTAQPAASAEVIGPSATADAATRPASASVPPTRSRAALRPQAALQPTREGQKPVRPTATSAAPSTPRAGREGSPASTGAPVRKTRQAAVPAQTAQPTAPRHAPAEQPARPVTPAAPVPAP